ncbi:Metal-binding activator 1 [Yarrowia sp. C11]|nr:Metal-binding activator 1 [Yarrowia sp. C11]KAG5371112.1 Metal-binding activator 1 [Yarrowia sp. E02]
MILVQGEKYACLNCIRGHRSSTCDHTNRPLVQVRRRGRPNHACQHRLAVIAEPTCSCGMTAVLVPEHSVAGIKEEDNKKPGSSSAKKSTKSVGIIRIGAHSKKIIDTSNGKVTVLDTPVNQFLKENPSGNCTCAASGLEPEEYFDRLKQMSSCCSKEEKPASNGCCSGNKVKKEEDSHTHASNNVGNSNGNGNGHASSSLNPNPAAAAHITNNHQNSTQALPGVNTIYQAPGLIPGQTQGQANGYQYNSYYQQPSYMYNSAYYAGHSVQVQSEGVPQSIPQGQGGIQGVSQSHTLPQGHNLPQGQSVQVMTQPMPQVQNQVQGQVQGQPQSQPQSQSQSQTQSPNININMTNPNSPMFGQIDPSFSQMWKGDSPQQPVAPDSGPEDRLTPEEFFDMYFAPTCSIPGQCGCGDGCQCKGCPTHDSQTELEGVSSGERFTWE